MRIDKKWRNIGKSRCQSAQYPPCLSSSTPARAKNRELDVAVYSNIAKEDVVFQRVTYFCASYIQHVSAT